MKLQYPHTMLILIFSSSSKAGGNQCQPRKTKLLTLPNKKMSSGTVTEGSQHQMLLIRLISCLVTEDHRATMGYPIKIFAPLWNDHARIMALLEPKTITPSLVVIGCN